MKSEREDKALKKAIQDLPEVSPSGRLWTDIEEGLGVANQEKKSDRKWLKYAATLILLASVTAVWYSSVTNPSDGLSFGEEVTELSTDEFSISESSAEFDEFLEVECSEYWELCQRPEFKQLISQLTEIEGEVINIGLMIERTGYDAMLYKAKTKADQETVRIKKELVKLLRG